MAAVWLRFRAELRTRWRAWLGLALLLGLVGGAVLALAAGARRTDSAYRRFLRAQQAFDVTVLNDFGRFGSGPRETAIFDADELRRLPAVAGITPARHFYVQLPGVGAFVPPDDRIGTEVNRFKLLEGRVPDPQSPGEAVVSFTLAEQYDFEIGSKIQVFDPVLTDHAPPGLPPEQMVARRQILDLLPDGAVTVVGIEASPGEFPPRVERTARLLVHLSPALYPVADDLARFSQGGEALMVQLERGDRDTDAFLADLERLGGGRPLQVVVQRDLTAGVERSIRTQADSLWLLALLTAVTGTLVLAQLLARLMVLESADHPVLAALGMNRGQRAVLGMARATVIGMVGSVVAVLTAVAASRMFPVGLAAIAELEPGLRPDVAVLALGALAVAMTVIAVASWPAWRTAGVGSVAGALEQPGARTSRLGRALSWRGLPVAVFTGVRMALEPGRGRSSVPVRSSLAGMVLGIVVLVAALTFGSSLGHLLGTPRLYGQSWDLELTTYDEALSRQGVPLLQADPRVTGLAIGTLQAEYEVDGHRMDALVLDTLQGDVSPIVLAGRRPQLPDEIALGARTMRSLEVDVGDTVDAAVFGTDLDPMPMRVVGRAVFPVFGLTGRLGDGAFVSQAGGERISGQPPDEFRAGVLVRLAPGADLHAVVDDLNAELGPEHPALVIDAGKPTDIVNFGRVQGTPYLLGAILAVLATATLAHVLVSATRRRRRDLAVLKTLGFDQRQVRSTVAWHATTLVAVALLIGVPVGVASGRRLWTLFADNLGIVSVPRVPLLALLFLVAAAVLIANLVAIVPASLAARTRPADALRAE